jgi:predicted DNA-binding protein (UPF0251 family)
MVRPKNCRVVSSNLKEIHFKPQGIPLRDLAEEVLTLDEVESLRLADLDGLYHEKAAEQMGISRATFGRIVQSARHKVADALINGKAIRVAGGVVKLEGLRLFHCLDCENRWKKPFGTGRPESCPSCNSQNFMRVDNLSQNGIDPNKTRGFKK